MTNLLANIIVWAFIIFVGLPLFIGAALIALAICAAILAVVFAVGICLLPFAFIYWLVVK